MAESDRPRSTFANRVVLVTGAGSGIGRASAVAFANRGARVLVADLDEEGGQETARRIDLAGGIAEFQQCDVTDERRVIDMIETTRTRFGRLDMAHLNAGISGRPVLIHECELSDWQQIIDLNLTGTFLCLKHVLAHMVDAGGGAVVNTSSVSGLRPIPTMPAYSASKFGVTSLTRIAANDYGQYNIRVNAVCPGAIDTPMTQAWIGGSPEIAAQTSASAPLGRMGTANDVAEAVVWLASDAASFVTGATLTVDGAWTAAL